MFSTRIGSKLAAIGLAGAITFTAIGATAAYARANSGPPDNTPAAIQDAAKEKPGVFKNLVADIVKQSGLSRDVFKAGFKDGQSINEILAANSKDASAVKTAVLGDVDTRIQKAQADGKITQERATKLTANAPKTLDRLFAATPKAHHPKLALLGRAAVRTSAETIGIKPAELAKDLKNGQTIAQVAGDKTQAVIDALTTNGHAAIEKGLANGKITEAQAGKLKANLPERAQDFVSNPHTGHPGQTN